MDLKIECADRRGVQIRMPFNPVFCLDEEGTILHGGVLTTLLDSAFGLANFLAIDNVQTMATLDLRVDYLRPASSRADVIVLAIVTGRPATSHSEVGKSGLTPLIAKRSPEDRRPLP